MILVLNTAGSELSLALATDEGATLQELSFKPNSEHDRAIHDAKLALETAKLLQEEGVAASELSRIGLIIGPGSFTGLRIGLSFAKGLAYATGAGIVPIVLHDVMNIMLGGAEGLLVSPGYRPDLFYISETNAPTEIRIISGSELLELSSKRAILAHGYFFSRSNPFLPNPTVYISPSIAVIAQMTADAVSLTGAAIDALEPLYLTEFNVGKR